MCNITSQDQRRTGISDWPCSIFMSHFGTKCTERTFGSTIKKIGKPYFMGLPAQKSRVQSPAFPLRRCLLRRLVCCIHKKQGAIPRFSGSADVCSADLCAAHTKSGWWESNPRVQLGRLVFYHWTTPAWDNIWFFRMIVSSQHWLFYMQSCKMSRPAAKIYWIKTVQP